MRDIVAIRLAVSMQPHDQWKPLGGVVLKRTKQSVLEELFLIPTACIANFKRCRERYEGRIDAGLKECEDERYRVVHVAAPVCLYEVLRR